MRYSCLAPGKRLRPILCMSSAEAVGAHRKTVMDAACALEMTHCFSLIHDDLPALDNDALRRGRPTCHVEFGESIAILAGDALFALAFESLAGNPGEPARIVQALRLLGEASGSDGLVGGEVMDILNEGQDVDIVTLAYIHTRKTGALIAASCEIGALLGGGDEAQVETLREYGRKVGLAFQIADDILNETSTPEMLGKAAGSDRERQKATYPTIHGIEGSREAAKAAADAAVEVVSGKFPNSEWLQDLAQFAIDRVS
ncbi:MAG: polyprenyl synthetase family protein [Armatimonadetes bacterium]|nr:polyprenyl synthetase family protein [Armatimonadota bacterium]